MGTETELEEFMTAVMEPAILLYRPFPPTGEVGRSYLGGWPTLPDEVAWPVPDPPLQDDGGLQRPLHFYAQIDCADLPGDTLLPPSGMLYFFARYDCEEMYSAQPTMGHHAKVLFSPQNGKKPRQPPEGIPALEECSNGSFRYFLLPSEDEPSEWPRWPLRAATTRSWPDLHRLGESYRSRLETPPLSLDAYAETARELGVTDHVAAAGLHEALEQHWRNERNAMKLEPIWGWQISEKRLRFPGDDLEAFPQIWFFIEMLSRIILTEGLESFRGNTLDPCRDRMEMQAAKWLERAQARPFAERPTSDQRAAFRHWLTSLVTDENWTYFNDRLKNGMIGIGMAAGDSPAIAEALSEGLFEGLIGPLAFGGSYRNHQMLGHTMRQNSPPDWLSEQHRLLLSLASDDGIGFNFEDGGVLNFWINEDDLRARRFDRVQVEAAG